MSVASNKKDDGDHGIVILTGLGQRTEWQLPSNITRCPLNNCRQPFADRSALTAHYQEQHAPNMVFCEICDKPMSANNHINSVVKHYRDKHPNVGLPSKLLSLLRNARKSIQGRPTENVSLIFETLISVFLIHLPFHSFTLFQNIIDFNFS